MTLDPGGKLGEPAVQTELGIVTGITPEEEADGIVGGLLLDPGIDIGLAPTPLLVEGGMVFMYVPPPIFDPWVSCTGVGFAVFPELTVGRLFVTTAETCGAPVGIDTCPVGGLIPGVL